MIYTKEREENKLRTNKRTGEREERGYITISKYLQICNQHNLKQLIKYNQIIKIKGDRESLKQENISPYILCSVYTYKMMSGI